jgi:hypothetical protein
MTTELDLMALPQGDVRLLGSQVAAGLLASRELARVACVARDGTPRVFPMLFHWTGEELVLPTFAGAWKIGAMRANPAIAVTIDAAGAQPEVLLLRGRVEVVERDGILPEYAAAHRRYADDDAQADANVAAVDRPGVRMARISLRPAWVGVLDFRTRFPGGITQERFEQRG